MVRFSKLEKVLAAAVGIDLLRPGTTRAAITRAAAMMPQRAAPVAAASAVNPALLAAAPYVVGAGLGLGALQTEPGQDLLAAAEANARISRVLAEQRYQDFLNQPRGIAGAVERAPISVEQAFGSPGKRKASSFNKAVKAGMKAVRASKFDGKRGKITNAKRTFGKVTKIASRVGKGGKVSARGVSGVIKRAVSRYVKKKPKARAKAKKQLGVRVRGRDY
jgi:hypothetical protein